MTCRITVNDGANPPVVMDGIPNLGISFATIQGGGAILRFLDGTAARQYRWRKETYTISGDNTTPAGLRSLVYNGVLTITVETGLGTQVYTGYSMGPDEDWNMTGGQVSWSLVVEEN